MLLEPLLLRCGLRARNRAWLAPMTNGQSHDDGSLGDDELRWIERRADGGFGVVETCASHVSLDGQGSPGELGVYADALLPGLGRLASAIALRGAEGIVQIFHGGLRSPSSLTGHQPWSASTYQAAGLESARAATKADIARVIRDFGQAAVRAHAAGFSGVELHGAHGYLLCQFLSATLNTRTDEWGGSLEGRARLLREATRAVRRAVPASFAVGVRLSPEDRGNAVGLDLDESIQVASWRGEDHAQTTRGARRASLSPCAPTRRGHRGRGWRLDTSGGGDAPGERRECCRGGARGNRKPRLGDAGRGPRVVPAAAAVDDRRAA